MLQVRELYKRYTVGAGFFSSYQGWVHAVNGVSFDLMPKQIYGLVGESGSGKTTLARVVAGLLSHDVGAVSFVQDGVYHTVSDDRNDWHNKVRYVFQDPARSLNPRMRVHRILHDSLRYSRQWKGKPAAEDAIRRVLRQVHLDENILPRSPVALSGGQRQRVALARALITDPLVLICDEVVSSLDAPICKKILDLILELREERELSVLFIAHDLSTIFYLCDRVGVLYKGRLVEEGPTKSLARDAQHPYTRRLYHAVPRLGVLPQVVSAPLDAEPSLPIPAKKVQVDIPLSEIRQKHMIEYAPTHFVESY